jgi:alkylresorcinol/alkylpyrone synthase
VRVKQRALRALAAQLVGGDGPELDVFDNARIDERALAMPIEWYLKPHGFKERTEAYQRVGMSLAERAARDALSRAGVAPREVTGVVFVSTTGIATPSLDSRLANRLGFQAGVTRLPVWGLGCAGGVAGLARAAELAGARPEGHVLLVALELCTLSFDIASAVPREPGGGGGFDKKSLIAASLFSDGCAAAVVSGDRTGSGPRLDYLAGTSHLFPDTERVMGWDVEDGHLEVVLSPRIPDIVRTELPAIVAPFVQRNLGPARWPDRWILHPGGAKVMDAYRDALGLLEADAEPGSRVLRQFGNMSSPSVLFALADSLDRRAPKEGESFLLAALGPGFASELALLAMSDGGP